MKRVVYVVTSTGRDLYSAMTRVSIASLRVSNPDVRAVLVTDRTSAERFEHARDPLLDEIDERMVFDAPSGDDSYRNRFIKTNLRNLIDGRFLFLDSDMLIRGDLSEVFSCEADVAGAPNHSKESLSEQIWDEDRAVLDRMGWQVRSDVYINGGALFCSDTPAARRFGATWHDLWHRSFVQTGRYRDQPALNATLHDVNLRVHVLAHRFNAQVKTQVSVIQGAALWHCYAAAGDPPVTEFEAIVSSVLAGAPMPRDILQAAMLRAHPWRRESWRDDWMARVIQLKGYFGIADYLWFSSYRGRELRMLARKLLQRRLKGSAPPH